MLGVTLRRIADSEDESDDLLQRPVQVHDVFRLDPAAAAPEGGHD